MNNIKRPDFTKAIDVKAFLYDELGFCGCMELDEVISALKTLLSWANSMESRLGYEEFCKGEIGSFYLLMGLLDHADLIEHGSSIRHPWLTDDGERLLTALNKFSVGDIESVEGEGYNGTFY